MKHFNMINFFVLCYFELINFLPSKDNLAQWLGNKTLIREDTVRAHLVQGVFWME